MASLQVLGRARQALEAAERTVTVIARLLTSTIVSFDERGEGGTMRGGRGAQCGSCSKADICISRTCTNVTELYNCHVKKNSKLVRLDKEIDLSEVFKKCDIFYKLGTIRFECN